MPEDQLRELEVRATERWRVGSLLAAILLAVFVGFLLLVGFARPFLGTVLVPGVTIGVAFGILLLFGAWAVAGIYVYWANHYYDAAAKPPTAR